MTHTTHTIQSNDGHSLFYQTWSPDQVPKAVIIFQHGFCEHGGKYKHIAHNLIDKGYLVHALDLRGHGHSSGKRIYIDRFDQHVQDFTSFFQHIQPQYTERPLFILAHSIGGTIALHWAAQQNPKINGLILSGAALKVTTQIPWLLNQFSELISALFPHMPTLMAKGPSPYSRDKALLEKWKQDPLIYNGRIPARTGSEILKGTQNTYQYLSQITLPLLILHGTADTLIAPQGSQEIHDSVSSTDKSLIFYEDLRHEILNEPERIQILNDINQWIQKHIP